MAGRYRPTRPRPPTPSPSHSLFGLEKAVPPAGHPSSSLSDKELATTSGLSGVSKSADYDTQLPREPRRKPSSTYSRDSGYTQIIQSYADDEDENNRRSASGSSRDSIESVSPLSGAHTLSSLFPDPGMATRSKSPATPQTDPEIATRVKSHVQRSHYPKPVAPTFAQFSKRLHQKQQEKASPLSATASPARVRDSGVSNVSPVQDESSPQFVAAQHELRHQHHSTPISARISDPVDATMMPAPLDLSRKSQMAIRATRYSESSAPRTPTQQHPVKRLSEDSFTDDSFIIYTGAREVLGAMIKQSFGRRRKGKQVEQKDRQRVLSLPLEKYPTMKSRHGDNTKSKDRKFSWVSSRRSSIHHGVTHLLRKLSIVERDGFDGVTPKRPRREKQRAIPTTPYQRYGTDIWLAKNKKKRAKRRAEKQKEALAAATGASTSVLTDGSDRASHRVSVLPTASDVTNAFQSGRSKLIQSLDESRRLLIRLGSEKRRERLKQRIKLVGPTEIREEGAESWI